MRRGFFVYLTLVFFGISCMFLKERIRVDFARELSSMIFYPFSRAYLEIKERSEAKRKAELLSQKCAYLSLKLQHMREFAAENERLRKLLEFRRRHSFRLIPCEVVASVPHGLNVNYILSRGRKQGVEKDMVAIGYNGLIGKIREAGTHTSILQTLFDFNSSIGAIDQRSRVFGILRWKGGNFLFFEGVPSQGDVLPGDTIITSGMGMVYPKGIGIGEVVEIERKEVEMVVKVRPFENMRGLEEVFILTP
ncbi:rod shape-determining protein MreC [bacterium]|nr:MAG: rod shape-determining protein MreC [bacterium]